MAICIIPARGGSKRLPRKNVRKLFGKPLLGWVVSAAVRSGVFERVIVSTDDLEIASVARRFGAEVPFLRPAELSDDHTHVGPVLRHALMQLEIDPARTPSFCCIYATAAFVDAAMVRDTQLAFLRSQAKALFTVCRYAHPVQRALLRDPRGRLRYRSPEHALSRTQDLPEAMHDAGMVYWYDTAAFLDGSHADDAVPFLVERSRAEDIDTQEDFDVAERFFAATAQARAIVSARGIAKSLALMALGALLILAYTHGVANRGGVPQADPWGRGPASLFRAR
jgi:N-acylneuraminate cytidylyltransferase